MWDKEQSRREGSSLVLSIILLSARAPEMKRGKETLRGPWLLITALREA